MKGFLIKDLKLLINQKQFFLTFGGICLMFLVIYDDPFFVVGYLTVVFSIFAVNSIAYDEADHGLPYLFTLPISRKEYVREKYILAVGLMLSTWITVTAVSSLACVIRQIDVAADDLFSVSLASLTIAVFLLAFSIPIQLKFGAEKTKIATFMMMGLAFLIAFIVVRIVKWMDGDIDRFFRTFDALQPQMAALILGVMWVGLITVSYLMSAAIMEKKEL